MRSELLGRPPWLAYQPVVYGSDDAAHDITQHEAVDEADDAPDERDAIAGEVAA